MHIIAKLLSTATVFLAVSFSNAQTPSWEWAKAIVGNNANNDLRTLATDSAGNVYAAGYYKSASIMFNELVYLENNGDEDAFVVKYNAAGDVIWAKNIGGTGEERIYAITVDGDDNLYVTGDFASPTLIFGSTILSNTGNQDIFIVKFNGDGEALWAKSAAGSLYDYGTTIATDNTGNLFVAGSFYSTSITFGTYTLNSTGAPHDVFLVKYDTNGTLLWGKSAGGDGYDSISSATTDDAGNVFITGSFYSSSITFGTVTLTNFNNYGDLFVVKYDPAGNLMWAKRAGGDNYDSPRSIIADSNENLYLVGHFASTQIFFENILLQNSGVQGEIFLTKYGSDGTVIWAKKASGNNNDFATSVAIDNEDNAYITGGFSSGPLTFAPSVAVSTSDTDIFVAKYDKDGNAIWAKKAGGTLYDNALFAVIDNNNNLFVGGNTHSPETTFDSNTLLGAGVGDSYVSKMHIGTLGLNEFKASDISIYPNPVGNMLNIYANSFVKTYMISDINGRIILSGELSQNSPGIDTSVLQKGVYIVKFDNAAACKLIKE